MSNIHIESDQLFESAVNYPDYEFQERYEALVGLNNHKDTLTKILSLLINPEGLQKWVKKHHPLAKKVTNFVLKRTPLIVLTGDVGSGKSELALTIGDAVARQDKIDITLLPLSLSARGQGRVGEMTQLISSAYAHTIDKAKKLKNQTGKSRGAIILLVDEADAIAQSRENSQMHHEDKAGVNAFIRGVDSLGNGKLPAAVILCTNRLGALDPAIKRRAAAILEFKRPSKEECLEVLNDPLNELGFSQNQIKEIVEIAGNKKNRGYSFTFSDLTQRLIPSIIIDAYPDKSVDFRRALEIASSFIPTPPFKEKENG